MIGVSYALPARPINEYVPPARPLPPSVSKPLVSNGVEIIKNETIRNPDGSYSYA